MSRRASPLPLASTMRRTARVRLLAACWLIGSLVGGTSIAGGESAAAAPAGAQPADSHPLRLVLVTLDGMRWQEIFGGVDAALVADERFCVEPDLIRERYWHDHRDVRRMTLWPFLWSVIATEGVLVGDRDNGSTMQVTNPWWFSYPGYNEMLTGRADPAIDSNDKVANPNVTLLEALHRTTGFHGRVMAFASWDVFPFILNTERSGLPVNTGVTLAAAGEQTRWLNAVAQRAPRLWPTVRLDFLTHGYAMEALRHDQPRAIYIAYGETDDFAHDSSYDRYIDAAHRTDAMLGELWGWLQDNEFYRGRTNLIITTDHGRGTTPEGFAHHASPAAAARAGTMNAPDGVPGSDQIWLAAIGPGIARSGLVTGDFQQAQVAATALASLGFDSGALPGAAPPARELLR